MDKYGVKSTHEALKNKLINYISTVYLGKNDSLRSACLSEIEKTGLLYQEPYIEANHAYLSITDGIKKANLPDDVKLMLQEMISRNLGVFANPYCFTDHHPSQEELKNLFLYHLDLFDQRARELESRGSRYPYEPIKHFI